MTVLSIEVSMTHLSRPGRQTSLASRSCWTMLRHWAPSFAGGLSQQVVVAEGSLIRAAAGRPGAALTKPGTSWYCQMGRVRRAWRKGVRDLGSEAADRDSR